MASSISVRCTLFVIAILFAGIFAGCLSVRERLAARAERSGGDYRAECGSLASIALAEHLYHSHTNTENNAARSSFCTRRRLFAVSVLETAAIRRNLKKQKKCTDCFSTVHVAYQSENALQREPGVRVAITEQNVEALQGSLLQNTGCIPTQIQETTLPVPVFAPFEKTKEMHHLFQYGARCLSVRKRLAARAGRSGGDYRAECRSFARFTLAEHRYHSHTNTENNAARSGFCTGGRLSAVSVLGTAAIGRDLKNRKNAPPDSSTVQVACQSENAL